MLWTNIFAGFGGQGVLLIGQLLAYAGMYEGKMSAGFPPTALKCAEVPQTAPLLFPMNPLRPPLSTSATALSR